MFTVLDFIVFIVLLFFFLLLTKTKSLVLESKLW